MTVLVVLLMFSGALLMCIAAIGLVRLPDFYLRTAATTKAITLGVTLMLAGAALFFGEDTVTARVIAAILFLLLTSPVGAHMLGRAAYKRGVPLWRGTVADQWEGRVGPHPVNAARKPGRQQKKVRPKARQATRRTPRRRRPPSPGR
jgi:multicomponent Na+:H+ antiporter subunit G